MHCASVTAKSVTRRAQNRHNKSTNHPSNPSTEIDAVVTRSQRPPSVMSADRVKKVAKELKEWKLNPDIRSSRMLTVFDEKPSGVRSADWISFFEVRLIVKSWQ